MLCSRIFTRLGARYARRQVWSSVTGFSTRTTSFSGSPDRTNSSSWLLKVSVFTSVNPRPIITSLRLSENVVSGRSPPGVWWTE